MNNSLAEIAFVLDRSGSMESCAEAAIAGFNSFLRDQRKEPCDARFTLVLFDDQYEVPCASIPLAEVTELDTTTFVPRGSTALLDAIGRTIDDLGAKLAAQPEASRPGLVIVAILTDGLENASQKFTWKDISQKISHQRDAYKWQFLFLGANQDAIATAAQMSIGAQDSSAYFATAAGTRSTGSSLSRKMSAMRKLHARVAMSPTEAEDLTKPLRDIVAEEHRKEEEGEKPGNPPA